MKRSQSASPTALDVRCLVVMGTITVYALGGANAFGLDHFLPLLMSYVVMLSLLAREFLQRHARSTFRYASQPLPTALGLFALALVLTSILIDVSGLRSDIFDIYRQVSMLLIGMSPFLLAYRVTQRRGAGTVILLVAHAIMAICSLSIGLEAIGLTSFESYGSRYFGFLGDPAALMITFPVIVYAATERRVLLIISLVILLLTLSRGPMLIAICGIIIIAFYGQRRGRAEFFVLTLIVSLIAFLLSDNVGVLAQRFNEIDVNDGRLLTPKAGLALFADSPLYGHGYAALLYHYPTYDDFWAQIYGRYRDGVFPTASSTWVQMLSDGGLILAIPYFVIIIISGLYCLPRIRGWLKESCTQAVAGGGVWLILVFYVHHSSAWFLAGGTVLPLVMTILGALAGTKVFEQGQAFDEANRKIGLYLR